jgi:integrase
MSLRIVRRKRSPYWIVRGTVRGVRVEESTGVSDRRIAEEIRAKRESEIIKQTVYGRRATATFAEAALSYLESGGDKRFLEPIIKHFGITPIAKIDQDAIDRGARKVYPGVADSTRDRQFYTPTSAVMKHAAKRGWCSPIILERPTSPPGRVRWLSVDEADRLIDMCGPHLQPLVTFLFYTGARAGEAVWLDWRQVDLVRGHVMFLDTKNGESRGVPLHGRVIAALANLPHRDGKIFRRPDGLPYATRRTHTQAGAPTYDTSASDRFKKAFANACKRAGITDFSAHDCRHTWATWHYAANRDLGALQRLGGWKTIAMVMRYSHVNVGELRHTIDRLPAGGLLGHSISAETKSA